MPRQRARLLHQRVLASLLEWAHRPTEVPVRVVHGAPAAVPAGTPAAHVLHAHLCGRPETRGLEYRRCPVLGIARYYSRTCPSLHWSMGHTRECVPVHQWLMEAIANLAVVNVDANAAAIPAVNSATDHNNLGGRGAAPAPPM